MIIQVREVPPSPNVIKRKYRDPHVYKRLRQNWETLLSYAVRSSQERQHWQNTVKGGERIRLEVRLYHKKLYDADNLVGSMKVVIDALKNVGYIQDDDADHFELGSVEQFVSFDEMGTILYLSVSRPEAA